MPKVNIILFASLKDQLGRDQVQLPINGKQKVSHIIKQLRLQGPILVAINRGYVDAERILQDGDEVALMPPLSGG